MARSLCCEGSGGVACSGDVCSGESYADAVG